MPIIKHSALLGAFLASFLMVGMSVISPALADPVKRIMLPPSLHDGSNPCTEAPANQARILVWDGVGSLKCVTGINVTGFSGDGSGGLSIAQGLTVGTSATVSGLTSTVGGLVLPKVTPAAPAVGQIWLVP
jgi:hypothetical protein